MATIAITGATGYVGSVLAAGFKRNGDDLLFLTRGCDHASLPQGVVMPWRLGQEASFGKMPDMVIHAAWQMNATDLENRETNVRGSLTFLNSCFRQGVPRIVFVSSMSAYDGTPSLYGISKRMVEEAVLSQGGTVVRPGLVWGEKAGGMFGAIQRLVRRFPLLAIPSVSYPSLFMCHAEDLSRLFIFLANSSPSAIQGKTYIAAHRQPVFLSDLVNTIAAAQGRKRFLVQVPWQLPWMLLKAAENLGLRLPLRSESLLNIVRGPAASCDTSSLEHTGMVFRGFEP